MNLGGDNASVLDYSCSNLKSETFIDYDNEELPLNLSVKQNQSITPDSSSRQSNDAVCYSSVFIEAENSTSDNQNFDATLFHIKSEPVDFQKEEDYQDSEVLGNSYPASVDESEESDHERQSTDGSYQQHSDLIMPSCIKTEPTSYGEIQYPLNTESLASENSDQSNIYFANPFYNLKSECEEICVYGDKGGESDTTIDFDPESEEYRTNEEQIPGSIKADLDSNSDQDEAFVKVEKVSYSGDAMNFSYDINNHSHDANELLRQEELRDIKIKRFMKSTYQCAVCGDNFIDCKDFITHKDMHKDNNPLHCRICGKCFQEYDSLAQHMRRCHGERYKCHLCDKVFKQRTNLVGHMSTHTDKYLYNCKNCDKGYNEKSFFLNHVKSHTRAKPHKCHICNKGFTHDCVLKRHVVIHSGSKPFKCETCGRGFNQKGNLMKHIKTYCGDNKFPCEYCGLEFTYKQLPYHCRTHNEKPYKCQECGKKFEMKITYEVHVHKHTMAKPFKCSVCEKAFTQQSSLWKHMLIHSDEKPFKCEVCGKSFNQKGNLKQHSLTHTNKKPFKCDICGKCFYQSCYLMTHRRTHTGNRPFKCPECEKSFNTSSNLKQHLRTHSGEKPFECGDCGKCFSQKNNWENHLRTHTGVKPFECGICGKFFNQKSNLNQHLKSCRKKEAQDSPMLVKLEPIKQIPT